MFNLSTKDGAIDRYNSCCVFQPANTFWHPLISNAQLPKVVFCSSSWYEKAVHVLHKSICVSKHTFCIEETHKGPVFYFKHSLILCVQYKFILICLRTGLNLDLWNRKQVCYQLSHPCLFYFYPKHEFHQELFSVYALSHFYFCFTYFGKWRGVV